MIYNPNPGSQSQSRSQSQSQTQSQSQSHLGELFFAKVASGLFIHISVKLLCDTKNEIHPRKKLHSADPGLVPG